MHNLKVEDYVLFSGLTEGLSTGYSLSDSSEGLFQRGMGGTRIYRSFCKKKTQVVEQQEITANYRKTGHLKLMNLVLFCVWEDTRIRAK